MDPKPPEIELKKITTNVRPSRYAVLINSEDPSWQHICDRTVEHFSQTWGGAHNILIPSDGNEIRKPFWDILELYSPDYFSRHIKTFADLEQTHPAVFNDAKAKHIAEWISQGYTPEQADSSFLQAVDSSHDEIEPKYKISEELKTKLSHLNPFFSETDLLINYFRSGSGGSHKDTSVIEVFSEMKNRGKFLTAVDFTFIDIPHDLELYIRSITGSTRALVKNWKNPRVTSVAGSTRNISESEVMWQEFQVKADEPEEIEKLITNPLYEKIKQCIFPTTRYGLAKFIKNKRGVFNDSAIIITGSSVLDFCLYYSLARLSPYVFWLPDSLFSARSDETPLGRLLQYLAFEISSNIRDAGFVHPKVVFTSLSDPLEVIKEKSKLFTSFGASFDGAEVVIETELNVKEHIKSPTFVLEAGDVNNVYLEQFWERKSLNLLRTPKPRTFSEQHPFNHRWIVDIGIKSPDSNEDPAAGYVLPAAPALVKKILSGQDLNYIRDSSNIRWTNRGLSFYAPTYGFIRATDTIDDVLPKPRVYLPPALEAFTDLFEAHTLYLRPSDKGRYMQSSIELFGSLANLASELKDPRMQAILDCYVDASEGRLRTSSGVSVNRRSYLSLNDFNTLIGNKEETRRKIDGYVQRGVLQRGIILQCENCREAEWYGMGELGQDFICKRCQKRQTYTHKHWRGDPDGDDLSFSYKLHEMVFQGAKSNMIVPILTLAKLQKDCSESFLYIPEVEVRESLDSERPLFEIDVLASCDGQLKLGEAKINSDAPQKLAIYNKICNKMGANFVFSTFEEAVSTAVTTKIDALEWEKDTQLINKKDLNA